MTISIYAFAKKHDLSKSTVQRRVKALNWPTDKGLSDEQAAELLCLLGEDEANDAQKASPAEAITFYQAADITVQPAGSYDFGETIELSLPSLGTVQSLKEQRRSIADQLKAAQAHLDSYDAQLSQLEIQKAAEDAYNHELAKHKASQAAAIAARKHIATERAHVSGLMGNG